MADLVWTVTAPYLKCAECGHPGPPGRVTAMTITQPSGTRGFYLIPHAAGCSRPNPFDGPSATVVFDKSSELAYV